MLNGGTQLNQPGHPEAQAEGSACGMRLVSHVSPKESHISNLPIRYIRVPVSIRMTSNPAIHAGISMINITQS